MVRLRPCLPLAAFVAVATALGLTIGADRSKMPSMQIDRAAPAFALAPINDGDEGLSSEDLKSAVALLNIFASWRPVGRAEHPFLLQLAETRQVPIFGINWKDDLQNGLRCLREHKSPYNRVGVDANGQIGGELGVTGAPETLVIDRTGRVRHRHPGPLTQEVWREIFEPSLTKLRSA